MARITKREYDRDSVSRAEEHSARGTLSRPPLFDPQNDPRENWADDPTPAEQRELERDERQAA